MYNPPEIRAEEITYYERIGQGCFGTVFRGLCRGKEVAVKKLRKQQLTPATLSEFMKEVRICCSLLSPNIVLFMGACNEPGSLAIVTEFMANGDLERLLRDKSVKLSLKQRLSMARDCALGMNWLHKSSPPILHRDLKPSNLLVDQYLNVKVCDFGLSCIKVTEQNYDSRAIPGTPLWMSPEVFMGQVFDERCDVYSFGIVFWEIYTRAEPFAQFKKFREFRKAICFEQVRPPIPNGTPPEIERIMAECWEHDPEERPTFEKVLEYFRLAIVATSIEDQKARYFWLSRFPDKETVSWDTFTPFFSNDFKLAKEDFPESHLKWRCFHALVTSTKQSNGSVCVDMNKFGQVVDLFAPMRIEGGYTILDRITDSLQHCWFHGSIDRDTAVRLLTNCEPGTFLVRYSSTARSCFTISKTNEDKNIVHQQIKYNPISGYSFTLHGTSVDMSVVDLNLPTFIKRIAPLAKLRTPAPGWPYGTLFKSSATDDYVD